MLKIHDEPESPNEGACLRNICQQNFFNTHPGAVGMLSGPEQRNSPPSIGAFQARSAYLQYSHARPEWFIPRVPAGSVGLTKRSSLCIGGVPEANVRQALHLECVLSCLLSILHCLQNRNSFFGSLIFFNLLINLLRFFYFVDKLKNMFC